MDVVTEQEFSTYGATAVVRGCGTREMGAVYVEVGRSPNGKKVEEFLIDQPRIVPSELPIPIRGCVLVEIGGIWHIVDRVGTVNYPNVADLIEEGRRYGFSRRVQKNLDFSRLSPESRLLLVHPHGWVENASEYYNGSTVAVCPTGRHEDVREVPCCSAIWWQDIITGPVGSVSTQIGMEQRGVMRYMPSFYYLAQRRPRGHAVVYRIL